MNTEPRYMSSILMLSLHGHVSEEPELGKPDTGGQVVYVLELAKRFSRLGYRVDLVTRRFEDQPKFDEVNEGFRIWRIPFGGNSFVRKEDMHDVLGDFVTNFLSAVRRHQQQYDVVYSHYWDAGVAGQKIAEELSIPHIHTPHSLGWWKQQNMPGSTEAQEKMYRFQERIRKEFLVYRSCDHIIATTEQQTALLQEQYDILASDVTVIPPGIDESRFSPVRGLEKAELRRRYGLQAHDVLTVGRMAHNKGYDLLIATLPILLQLVPEGRFIAGIGTEESEQDQKGIDRLRQYSQELGVADKVEWVQYIPDEDLVNYYRAAGVFALASRYEPFGMVAIEAMACGTPTVVTVHGGLYDLIDFGTHALLADPNRAAEYGTMLALPLLYPALADKLSVAGARFARRTFGWTGIARRILAIFDQFKSRYVEED